MSVAASSTVPSPPMAMSKSTFLNLMSLVKRLPITRHRHAFIQKSLEMKFNHRSIIQRLIRFRICLMASSNLVKTTCRELQFS
jgi:hypothetical protein